MYRPSGIRLEYRLPRLLNLQEDWVVVGRHEQPERAIGADAAHADDLNRKVKQPEAVKKRSNVLGQRFAIACERVGVSRRYTRGLLVCWMEDQRRHVLDPRRRA